MVFPILGGNSAVAGYSIDNSLRFNDDDSPYLSRTPSGSGTTGTWTFSCWVKRGVSSTSSFYILSSGAVNQRGHIYFNSDNFIVQPFNSTGASAGRKTEAVFRDHSAWYHFLIVANGITTANLATNLDVYVNGVEFSTIATGSGTPTGGDRINDGQTKLIGQLAPIGGGGYYDGYLSEFHFIDGQALSPTDFGEFDSDSGIWKPIQYTGSYGTNGFYLDFENSGSLGADQSGNGNNFTPTNLSATDQVLDSPTNNFATLNGVQNIYTTTLSEGNLKYVSTDQSHCTATIGTPSGKWYAEFEFVVTGGDNFVITEEHASGNTNPYSSLSKSVEILSNGRYRLNGGSTIVHGASYTNNDILMVALDIDSDTLYYGKNGLWAEGDGTSDASFAGASGVDISGENFLLYLMGCTDVSGVSNGTITCNFGQDSSFAGSKTRQNNSDGNGYGDFYYAPPSGYLALCTQNLATALSPTIDDGSAYFHTQLYTGNGGTQSITNDANAGDFKPDFAWIKERSSTSNHVLMDTTRGTSSALFSSLTNAESSTGNFITSFDTDGFTLGNNGGVNESSQTYVNWQWKANGGTTSSNTDGSITSTVQANTTAGFSIVTYTGNGTAGATIGHGLGQAPDMTIIKRRSTAETWIVWHTAFNSAQSNVRLESTGAVDTASPSMFNNTFPTSSLITLGNGNFVNTNAETYVCYAFKSVEGYSKFGSYTGNGNADGAFVYTGFRPAWLLIKKTDVSGSSWFMWDNKRSTYNQMVNALLASGSDAELTDREIDFTSNGFKTRATDGNYNGSGNSYIYMAFAESPFCTSSGVPVVAR